MATSKFGRVDDENNVYVLELGNERRVGQYPGVTKEEALAYYERKFADLEALVRLLEQRVKNKIDAAGLKKQASKLEIDLKEPAAVGDLAELRNRVAAVAPQVEALSAEKFEANKEAVAEAMAKRADIVARVEKITGQDPAKIQWKKSSEELTKLFEEWQAVQKSGARVPKAEADVLWKRFSTARTKFESAKRAYFATLDATNKAAKAKKNEIVAAAEALAAKGSDSTVEYRKLLDAWKAAPRTPGKSDDALWLRFKAAGDTIYSARQVTAAVENEEYSANLAKKLELLKEAASIDPQKDLAEAKKQLRSIQQRWEKAGRVPKEKLRETDDKLKAIEAKVAKVEQDHWRKTDPATIDRTNSVLDQLQDSIDKLEKQIAAATAAKNTKQVAELTDALKARQAWFETVKASAN